MARDVRQQQKKVAKQKAKEKARKKELAVRSSPNPAIWMPRAVASSTLLPCRYFSRIWENGIGTVLVSRLTTRGDVLFVNFLVDTYCLGVKDVIYRVVPQIEFEQNVLARERKSEKLLICEPAYARKLVEGAVEYAKSCGISPCPEYRYASLIFGDVDSASCQETFTFGRDGKPFFVAGPRDTPERCLAILAILSERFGEQGFHYIMPVGSSMQMRGNGDVLRFDSPAVSLVDGDFENSEFGDNEEE